MYNRIVVVIIVIPRCAYDDTSIIPIDQRDNCRSHHGILEWETVLLVVVASVVRVVIQQHQSCWYHTVDRCKQEEERSPTEQCNHIEEKALPLGISSQELLKAGPSLWEPARNRMMQMAAVLLLLLVSNYPYNRIYRIFSLHQQRGDTCCTKRYHPAIALVF